MSLSPQIVNYANRLGVDLDEAKFPDGWSSAWRTLDQVAARSSVKRLNPIFRDRVFAIMLQAWALGIAYGIGGTARDPDRQLAEFYRRHSTSDTGRASRWFSGVRYWLRRGMAPFAPPGQSNHEDDATPSGAIAVDAVPPASRAQVNRFVGDFFVKHFTFVNREPWHLQPSEFGNSRSSVRKAITSGQRLVRRAFPLPQPLDSDPPAGPNPFRPPPTTKNDRKESRTVKLTVTLTELREGDRGRDAATAQALMNAHSGSTLEVDGHFGKNSVAQLKAIQAFVAGDANHKSVDGICGPKTWAILLDPSE